MAATTKSKFRAGVLPHMRSFSVEAGLIRPASLLIQLEVWVTSVTGFAALGLPTVPGTQRFIIVCLWEQDR